jgi:hypothetical protein
MRMLDFASQQSASIIAAGRANDLDDRAYATAIYIESLASRE